MPNNHRSFPTVANRLHHGFRGGSLGPYSDWKCIVTKIINRFRRLLAPDFRAVSKRLFHGVGLRHVFPVCLRCLVFLLLDGPGDGRSIAIAGLVGRFVRLLSLGRNKDDLMSCNVGRGIAVSGDIQRRAFLPCFLFRRGGLAAGFFFTGAFALDLPFSSSFWRLEGGIMLLMHDFYAHRRFFSFQTP